MFGVRLSKLGSASKLGLIAKAIAILRSYGADAHIYLPGVGTINGITAGNYLDSAGTTAASVDNPVGLSLDGLGAWEDVPQNWVKASGDGVVTAVGNTITITGATTTTRVDLSPAHPFVDGYLKAEFTVTWSSATSVYVYIAGGASVPVNGTRTTYGISSKNSALDLVQIDSGTATFVIHSLRLNRGIFASQATTANKALLKSAAGKYWWQFDSTDLLTATYPAGYESATIINALTSGVTTNQGVNVVGSYSIGPSVNTAGRILLKTAPTAEELAVLQSFMGLLI